MPGFTTSPPTLAGSPWASLACMGSGSLARGEGQGAALLSNLKSLSPEAFSSFLSSLFFFNIYLFYLKVGYRRGEEIRSPTPSSNGCNGPHWTSGRQALQLGLPPG